MKIAKDLHWLDEYIKLARPKVKGINKLKRVSSKTPKRTLTENQTCHGIITKYYNEKDHRITLYTKFLDMTLNKGQVELSIKHYSVIDILCAFAHELAHLDHWDHTPEHKILESELTIIFMEKLKQDGYISEEMEEKGYQRCRRINNGR